MRNSMVRKSYALMGSAKHVFRATASQAQASYHRSAALNRSTQDAAVQTGDIVMTKQPEQYDDKSKKAGQQQQDSMQKDKGNSPGQQQQSGSGQGQQGQGQHGQGQHGDAGKSGQSGSNR